MSEIKKSYDPFVFTDKDKNFNAKLNEQENVQSLWNEIAVGCLGNGNTLIWDTDKFTHASITGDIGTSRGQVLNNIFDHCLTHNEQWDIYAIDLKKVKFSKYEKYATVKEISKNLKTSLDLLVKLRLELDNRYDSMLKQSVNNFQNLEKDTKAVILIIEDISLLKLSTKNSNNSPDNIATGSSIAKEIINLLRIGRAAGIHVVISSINEQENVLPSLMKNELIFTLNLNALWESSTNNMFYNTSLIDINKFPHTTAVYSGKSLENLKTTLNTDK